MLKLTLRQILPSALAVLLSGCYVYTYPTNPPPYNSPSSNINQPSSNVNPPPFTPPSTNVNQPATNVNSAPFTPPSSNVNKPSTKVNPPPFTPPSSNVNKPSTDMDTNSKPVKKPASQPLDSTTLSTHSSASLNASGMNINK